MTKFEKYLVITICLLLSLGIVGCKQETNDTANAITPINQNSQQSNQSIKQEQKITPTFEVKKYSTPFIKFDYPANWDDSDEVQFYGDKDSIKVIVGDKNDGSCITVKQKFDKNINSASQARTQFIELCDSMQSIEYIDKTSFINGNIAILEGIVYGKYEMHAKEYFWNNGKGKTYQIEISTNNGNWGSLKEVIQVFEQSIDFKK